MTRTQKELFDGMSEEQIKITVEFFSALSAGITGDTPPEDLCVEVWQCPYCGQKHDSMEAAAAHDGECPKHPGVQRALAAEARAKKAEAENVRLRDLVAEWI